MEELVMADNGKAVPCRGCRVGTPGSAGRKRTQRAIYSQVEALLAQLERSPHLTHRRMHGRGDSESGWKKITQKLNSIPRGAKKTPEQWMTVWRDIKSRACVKAAKLGRLARTGKREAYTPLTAMEKRIIAIVGIDCPDDSMQEHVKVRIFENNIDDGEIKLEVIELSQSESSDTEQPVQEQSIVTKQQVDDTMMIIVPPDPLIDAFSEQQEATAQSEDQQTISNSTVTSGEIPPPTRQQRRRQQRNRNVNPRRTVAEQHTSARQEFLAIAESNAQSMRMLAEATKMQAEASLLLAQATTKIGDALVQFLNKNNT